MQIEIVSELVNVKKRVKFDTLFYWPFGPKK